MKRKKLRGVEMIQILPAEHTTGWVKETAAWTWRGVHTKVVHPIGHKPICHGPHFSMCKRSFSKIYNKKKCKRSMQLVNVTITYLASNSRTNKICTLFWLRYYRSMVSLPSFNYHITVLEYQYWWWWNSHLKHQKEPNINGDRAKFFGNLLQ